MSKAETKREIIKVLQELENQFSSYQYSLLPKDKISKVILNKIFEINEQKLT